MTLYVLAVIFVATTIRSTFGFGEALVAVPLLALRIPVQVATPLAVLVSVTVAGIVVAQDWRMIHLRSASWLFASTVVGIPLGLVLLKTGNAGLTKTLLGLVIIAFSVFSLSGRWRMRLRRDHRAWLVVCGFCAGVLGAAYGMNGPPLVVYGVMRRWSAQHFRATLQAYFLPASLAALCGYWLAGVWSWPITRFYLLSLPPTLVAVLLGRAMNHRLRGDAFLKLIYCGLACVGFLLIAQAGR